MLDGSTIQRTMRLLQYLLGKTVHIHYIKILLSTLCCDGKKKSYISSHLDPMVYPLLFPCGEQGWHINIPHVEHRQTRIGNKVTMQEFKARLHDGHIAGKRTGTQNQLAMLRSASFCPTRLPKWCLSVNVLGAFGSRQTARADGQ